MNRNIGKQGVRQRRGGAAVLAGVLMAALVAGAEPPSGLVSISGTVVWKSLEAGFYAIEADDGARYVPINLPAEYKVAGTRIQATVRVRDEMMGVQLYGRLVEIVGITPLPSSEPPSVPGAPGGIGPRP